MSDELRKAAQDVIDRWHSPKWAHDSVHTGVLIDRLRAALQSCPDCGKPAPEGSIHTCSPQKPDSDVAKWEGEAVHRAFTVGTILDGEQAAPDDAKDAARWRKAKAKGWTFFEGADSADWDELIDETEQEKTP
jgi:hypothetical protein